MIVHCIFAPNSGYVVRLSPFIRDKSPTKCDAQLPESNYQTRSNAARHWYNISQLLCNAVR
ncbi:MAG: DUF6783 domain-containing protein [Clostridiales bacterium]|nr:DUF6783 domain-containing protein [Clostridiales bacterium]